MLALDLIVATGRLIQHLKGAYVCAKHIIDLVSDIIPDVDADPGF